MKRLTVLITLLLAGVAHADSGSLCKPMCATDKRECRSQAAKLADDDTLPLLSMPDNNRNARMARGAADKPSEAQARQGYESRRVREQRTCDTQYLRCVQACANPATPKREAPRQQEAGAETPKQD